MNKNIKKILIFCLVIIGCKNEKSNQNYKDKQQKEKELLEFNPTISTDLDISMIDSIILEKYYKNKLASSKWVRFEFKSKVDTTYTVFPLLI